MKKAQQLEPKLYDGNVIEKTNAIVIPDSEETLMLAEESRSKMILKQKDHIMLEKKVNTTPVDYSVLNQLSQDFETRFVPQIELSAEQAFWSQNSMNSPEPTLSSRPTKVEVPKELPKVSMVNTSLKKLKHHLAGFDMVVKERTTPITITEWGFEHTKAYFRDEIIPIVKALKDLFNTFDQYLIDELSEVQNVFHQMEQAVEQHCLESKIFEVKMNQVLNENERLLEQVISKDTVNMIVNSSVDNASVNVHECVKCLKLETELLNKKDFVEKEIYDKLFKTLKDDLRKLKGKALVDNDVTKHPSDPEMLKIYMKPITPKLLNKRTSHSAYIKHTQEEAAVLWDLVDHVKANYPLDYTLDSACREYTSTEVPIGKPTALDNETSKPAVTLVYSWKPRKSIISVPISKSKVSKSVLLTKKEPRTSLGDPAIVSMFPSSLLMNAGVQNVQSNSEKITWQRYWDMVDLSIGNVNDIKASKTKSLLWHRRLSHLNFGAISHLARHGLVRGLPKLKFEKDHLCSACAMGKSKKKPHNPKSEDTNQEKLYLLHIYLYGPIRVTSVNGKKYILVIVNDYSRFTWVKCLRSKDEAPDFIIKFLKMIQVRFKVPIRRIRTNNETEFVNQTLREYYEKVGISYETSIARSPQQNGV
ncbi:retrovirus-related pol polyprotein from transposon TNT 1-94 [Tanacetum coccineum]